MMEDYEKKHKEEVERATQLWEGGDITREQLEYIFPELKESEDEEIRKGLIKAFGSIGKKEWGRVNVKNAIAWLEKQSEQKPYGQRKECKDCQFNYAGECKGFCRMKRDKQKPAWREEDDYHVRGILSVLQIARSKAFVEQYKDSINSDIDWLESLKQRIR